MKISSIVIKGFKGLRHFELEPVPNLLVLVGSNGSGKSSVFEAIGLLKDHLASYTGSTWMGPHLVNAACEHAELRVAFTLSANEAAWLVAKGFPASPSIPIHTAAIIEGDKLRIIESDAGLCELLKTYAPKEGLGVLEHFAAYRRMNTSGITSMSLDFEPGRHGPTGASIREGRADYNEIMRRLAAGVVADFLQYRSSGEVHDSSKPIRELFNRLFAPKTLEAPQCSVTGGIQFQIRTRDGLHAFDGLSAGEQEAFMVLANIEQIAPCDSILLYDTPESHLNGAIERRIPPELERLVKQGNQVLVATHSLEFIEACPLEAIHHLTAPTSGNQVGAIAVEADKLRALESMGVSVGLQLISKTVVFVEGEEAGSDKSFFHALLPDLPSSVTLIPSRRVTTVMEASGRTFELIGKGTKYSRFFAIRDRDYLTNEDRQAFMAKYDTLRILERYHIENYLLSVDGIHTALRALGLSPPSDIMGVLEGIAAGIKAQATVDWAAFQMTNHLRSAIVQGSGPTPVAALKATTQKVCAEIQTVLNETRIDELVTERKKSIDLSWSERAWIKEFPGRTILRAFAGEHCRGTRAEQFLHLVASCAGALRTPEVQSLRGELASLFDG